MAKQLIPKVTPAMLRELPDQFCEILNRVIEKLNSLEN